MTELTPFQQSLVDAAGKWLDKALLCNKPARTDIEEYDCQCAYRQAKAAFMALVARGGDRDNEKQLCKEVEQLEQDSELLADLIEMLSKYQMGLAHIQDNSWNVWVNYDITEGFRETPTGSSPREAIHAAVKAWKERVS